MPQVLQVQHNTGTGSTCEGGTSIGRTISSKRNTGDPLFQMSCSSSRSSTWLMCSFSSVGMDVSARRKLSITWHTAARGSVPESA